jgi:hypothetical protein
LEARRLNWRRGGSIESKAAQWDASCSREMRWHNMRRGGFIEGDMAQRRRDGSIGGHLNEMQQYRVRIHHLPSPRQLCQSLGRVPPGMTHHRVLASQQSYTKNPEKPFESIRYRKKNFLFIDRLICRRRRKDTAAHVDNELQGLANCSYNTCSLRGNP